MKKFDWLNLLKIMELRNEEHINLYNAIDFELAKKQMASFNGNWHYGFDSLYHILKRIPLFWLVFPILFLLKITNLGQKIYMRLAVKRKIIPLHCDIDSCGI
jgi:hypothetical protein